MSSSASPAEAVSAFVAAQEELAGFVERSVELRREAARLDALRLAAVYEAVEFAVRRADAFVVDRGSVYEQRDLARRGVIAELAVAWRVSEYTVQRWASDAFLLHTALPATLAALRAGEIDGAHVRVIVHEVGALNLSPEVAAEADVELVRLAGSKTPAELRRAAKRLLEQKQLETVAERHARAFADRSVRFEPAHNGMAWLSLYLRASDAMLVSDRLEQAAMSARADGNETRTRTQIEVDLARDLLLNGVPVRGEGANDGRSNEIANDEAAVGGRVDDDRAAALASGDEVAMLRGISPTVHVTVPVLTLLGIDDQPGDLDGYGPIDPDTARRLAAKARSFTRLLTDPISGAVLDVDRRSYRVPSDLRRWLQVRDETCRFPGCGRRARNCELDHSQAWAADHGKTAHDNLAHLCSNHHHLKHETAWSLMHLPDGVLEWTSLTGTVHRTTPAGTLRASAAADNRVKPEGPPREVSPPNLLPANRLPPDPRAPNSLPSDPVLGNARSIGESTCSWSRARVDYPEVPHF